MSSSATFLRVILSILLFLLCVSCLLNYKNPLGLRTPVPDLNKVEKWLKETQLTSYKHLFKNHKGISALSQYSGSEVESLPELPATDEERLQRAATVLQQRLVLRQWLTEKNLQHLYPKLLAEEVTSLEDVYWLEDSKASQLMASRDFKRWSEARQGLPVSKNLLYILKTDLWTQVVKSSDHGDAWTWGGMLVVSVSVAGLVTLAAMTQPSLAPEAKNSLLQYVTGKYLLASNCKVEFFWTDPCIVGSTVSFSVHFYQRNGNPYPICDTDNFSVEVLHGTRKISVISELGSPTEPNEANKARITFSVRLAGQYTINVLVAGRHVSGSPFTRTFIAGPAYAQRTLVIRHCTTVVCASGITHVLYIEPRDEYGNTCSFVSGDDPSQGYTISLKRLGESKNPSPVLRSKENCLTITDYNWQLEKVEVQIKFEEEGIYHAILKYEGVELQNGYFDIIVLNSMDASLVQKNIASKNHNVSYEAKLISINGDVLHKPKRVTCYVSPKQLIIKEHIFKFIPKRLYTFRLCPSTKFLFQHDSLLKIGDSNNESFIVDDGCQPKIQLISKDKNVIAATFAQFLLQNVGGSETFKDKQDFFYHEVRKYHHKHFHDKLSLKVNRENLLESSMKATKSFSVNDWCKNFEVTFQGEIGIDWGGLRREWFELICAQLFDAKYGLFTSFHEGQQSLVHPNPKRAPHLKLKHFEFAGKIVGKCLYESALGGSYRQLVRARFTRSFLAQVIGLRVHYKYFEQDDPDLYLSKIKFLVDNCMGEIGTEVYFVEEIYDASGKLSKSVELIPNGSKIKVDNSTKLQYLDALAQFKLSTSIKSELEAFLKGLNELIPDNLLSIFDENELELLICGTGQYDLVDFKAHHVVNGNSAEFRRVVDWFWTAVANFTQEEFARLLQFTTGCSQLPPSGFKELQPPFQLTAAPTFGNLPTAHTCFNQLCLPDYDSYEHFEKSLLLAISEGTEGFGMV